MKAPLEFRRLYATCAGRAWNWIAAAARAVICVLLIHSGADAAFRGDERFARDFAYNSEYFFQSESFSLPSWWEDEWIRGDTGYRMALGSVKTDEFYLFQEGKIGYRLCEALGMGYRFLNQEDFDSRHFRHIASLSAHMFDFFRVKAFTELSAEKEWIDLGAEALFRVPGLCEGGISLNLVDMTYNLKSGGDGKYLRKPYALGFSAAALPARGVSVSASADLDLPLSLSDHRNGFVFAFFRYRLGFKASCEVAPYWSVFFDASGELCGKRWEYEPYAGPSDPPNPAEQALAREAMQARIEVVRKFGSASGDAAAAGFKWIQLRETTVFPNDRAADMRLKKRDFIFWVRACVGIGGGFFLMPEFYFGPVWHLVHYTNDPAKDCERLVPLNSKFNACLGIRFSENAVILAGASFATDRFEFDGGQASFVLSF